MQTKKQTKLLNRVIEFYQSTLADAPSALDYLNANGITDNNLISSYQIGFSNGSLLDILPDDKDITADLINLGVLTKEGKETFLNCITAPIYSSNGALSGICGINIQSGKSIVIQAETGSVFNIQAFKTNEEIILANTLIEAIAFLNAGFPNAIYCPGGVTDETFYFISQTLTKRVLYCENNGETF